MKNKLLSQDEIIKRELFLYKKSFDDRKINHSINIYNRPLSFLVEYDFNMPQTIFYLYYNGKIIVGRKTISNLYLTHKLKSINCSNITQNMFLGILESSNYKCRKISIQYFPFTNEEKKQLFNDVVNNITKYEIVFPFRFKYYDTNLEQISDSLCWEINDEIAHYLSTGEKHIRKYTIETIRKYKLKPKIVYDPACSTGEFLKTIKKELPFCKTIGHDMSKDMVEYSKQYVDDSQCCNAFDSPIKDESVDLLILRFLNGGVVDSDSAEKLFKLLIKKVKHNGYIICIGHTPILINSTNFETSNIELIQKIGYNQDANSIFQYYFARKR